MKKTNVVLVFILIAGMTLVSDYMFGNDVTDAYFNPGLLGKHSGILWTQEQKLTASDAETDDRFGISVSISGDYAIAGAYEEGTGGLYAGAAYIFKNNSGTWTQQKKMIASDTEPEDWFGISVSISDDYAIVGAYGEDTGGSDAGAAYIFKNNSGAWTQYAKLTASDAEANDVFGGSVSLSGDYAVIGAYYENTGGSNAGAAYIFKNNSGMWTQQAKLIASDADESDVFGISVSLSGDHAIIGAYQEDAGGSDAGAAYIFKNNSGTWTQQAKLTASDAESGDFFGVSVSISGDYAIIGANSESTMGGNAGAAYIFKNNSGTWTEQAKLTASDAESGDFFGISVSISGDYAIAGAYQEDTRDSYAGAAYIFRNNSGTWTEQEKLTAPDANAYDFFGISVSISGDHAIAGATGGEDTGSSNTGVAYIFKEPETAIDEDSTLPRSFGLQAAYPNPFNPAVTLNYNLIDDGQTILQIYNIKGEPVKTLQNEFQTAGNYVLTWQPVNISSGIYMVYLRSGNKTHLQKIAYVK